MPRDAATGAEDTRARPSYCSGPAPSCRQDVPLALPSGGVNLEELEREIRMHRRGRRNELLVIAAVIAVVVAAAAGLFFFLF